MIRNLSSYPISCCLPIRINKFIITSKLRCASICHYPSTRITIDSPGLAIPSPFPLPKETVSVLVPPFTTVTIFPSAISKFFISGRSFFSGISMNSIHSFLFWSRIRQFEPFYFDAVDISLKLNSLLTGSCFIYPHISRTRIRPFKTSCRVSCC
jgi:hypothetical protein